ncbi:unnamed protein product [Adineta ricciae]|uniref:alpha-L-rhamnosidase n=1 Tax=Adineta ricciae TaxID=249248 RepID=A0A813WT80_ADIRI|nr:unnamed protein product [Adineta ricciae]CAF1187090.1 unnamed protein product [Adineta ricciae]
MDVTTHSDIVIDTHTPHFSWQLADEYSLSGELIRNIRQIGYHIRVYNTIADQLAWDSGYVSSPLSLYTQYAGVPFSSDTRYNVSIKYYTIERESQWYTARFRTALFSLTDWTGQWIGSNYINMNQLRTVVDLKPIKIQSASAFISGVGFYQMYIEGQLIDPSRRLDVGWTTYQQRTLYTSYDLTDIINTTNERMGVGIVLGQGWYNQQQWAISLNPHITLAEQYGPPRALLQLNIRYVDGTNQSIVTDSSWLGREGEHRFDSVYMGTTMDLRATLACWSCANFSNFYSAWLNASILSSPVDFTAGGQFSLQIMDPIRIGPGALHIATSGQFGQLDGVQGASLTDGGVLKPISQDMINGQVFDLGQNFAGWCKISSLNASKSTIIQMRYGELRYSRGVNGIDFAGLYYENLDSIAVMDTVVLNGTGNEAFEPLFTSHGFRYLLVNGYNKITKNDVECYNAHSETTLIGNFSSSSVVLNQIQHNILWSQLSNSMSLPMGCPQRNDRTGWLGDAGLSVDAALYNFDYIGFYLNFLTMIADNQTPEGAVSDTVPFMTGFLPADPNWGTAYVTITWCLYEHTGDMTILDRYYVGIQKWIDYSIGGYNKTGLANMYFHFGDWVPVQKVSNNSLVSSYAFLRDVYTFVNMSQLLNRTANIERYSTFYQQLSEEWNRVFYNASVNGYVDGSQTANILSLASPNVVPSALRDTVLNSLITNLQSTGYFTGGIISVAALYPLLSKEGYHDLALKLALSTSYPSYGYMFNNQIQNATTTWEQWNSLPNGARSSLNHHMFNSIGGWFYRYLAGIELNALNIITIQPRMTYAADLLNFVEAEVVTIRGSIEVKWRRASNESILLSVVIPNNMNAVVHLDPLIRNGRCMKLMCDDNIIWIVENQVGQRIWSKHVLGVTDLMEDPVKGTLLVKVVSGAYKFMATWE